MPKYLPCPATSWARVRGVFSPAGASHEVKLTEKEKNRKLNDLLDALEFNQVRPRTSGLQGGQAVLSSPVRPGGSEEGDP